MKSKPHSGTNNGVPNFMILFIVSVFLTSRLIIGGAGSGKSLGVIRELLEIALQGLCAIVLMDHHGLTARMFMLHLIDNGLDCRVLYDRFADFHRALGGMAIGASNH